MTGLLMLFFLVISISLSAQVKSLSDTSRISILIDSPVDVELFTIFGHAAVRVWDPQLQVDHVFNYGVFHHTSTFRDIAGLLKGKQMCELFVVETEDFKQASIAKGSSLKEYTLNLSQEEKESLWQALLLNALPQNRQYEYDIFRKNCVTLPALLLKKSMVARTILSPDEIQRENKFSYRDLCTPFLIGHPWKQFFADMYFGTIVEKKITPEEELFLPERLEHFLLTSLITDTIGQEYPLVSEVNILLEEERKPVYTNPATTPFVCSISLLLLIIILTFIEFRKKIYFRWIDYILFGIAGLIGIFLWSMITIYSLWYTIPNWWMGWFHPFHLVGVVFFSSGRLIKPAYYYHIGNILLLSFLMAGKSFLIQHYNEAFIPLMLCLWIRSAAGIIRYRKYITHKPASKNLKTES